MFNSRRWSREPFLRAACDLMVEQLDWDSINGGSLHEATSAARTLDGEPVVVGVLDRLDVLSALLVDAADVRTEGEWAHAPLWLYAPPSLDLDGVDAVVHRVPTAR